MFVKNHRKADTSKRTMSNWKSLALSPKASKMEFY
jgi:hypothetical protein